MSHPFMIPLEKMESVGANMRMQRLSLRDQITNSIKVYTESGEELDMDRAVRRTSVSLTVLRKLIGGRKETADQIIAECTEKGIIEDPVTIGRSKTSAYTYGEQVKVLNYIGKPFNSLEVAKGKYIELNPTVIAIANRKGGTGKSTIVQTLASKLALDLDLMGRVCIVDLDTQGSNISFCRLKGDPHQEIPLTLTDILVSDYESEEYNLSKQYEEIHGFEDMILNTPYPTHIPTLDIMPSLPSDERIVGFEKEPEAIDAIFKKFYRVLEILKTRYDYIIFDTPPSDSFNTWLAIDVADYFLTPFRPHELDYDATSLFLSSTPSRLRELPSQGKNLKDFKILITDHESKSISEGRVKHRTIGLATGSIINGTVEHSEAFKYASETSQFIWDLYTEDVSRTQYTKAMSSLNPVYDHFKQDLMRIANPENDLNNLV
ncbi:ParA family protein [Marinomonas fungiae]|uniref:Cellulose biosynthesis protein BcsQ n=1 Tax=Marinomonas fungiae TaxID=1137284 RepID=A0A0K6IUG6_9GAMM|nr:ParA family protein [Marinomonas fungiae]CUB06709.1 Cellulose biosynthesis protein BcsQ [Marinomonas fungiae]